MNTLCKENEFIEYKKRGRAKNKISNTNCITYVDLFTSFK